MQVKTNNKKSRVGLEITGVIDCGCSLSLGRENSPTCMRNQIKGNDPP